MARRRAPLHGRRRCRRRDLLRLAGHGSGGGLLTGERGGHDAPRRTTDDRMPATRPPPDEPEHAWRARRRANTLRLLVFPAIVVLFALGWLLWVVARADPASGR